MPSVDPKTFQGTLDSWHEPDGGRQFGRWGGQTRAGVMRPRIRWTIVLALVVAACAGGSGSPAGSATGSPVLPSLPMASASEVASAPGASSAIASPAAASAALSATAPVSAAPSATATRSARPTSTPMASRNPAPSPSTQYPNNEPPVPSWMTGSGSVQAQLLAQLRDDAKVACAATGAVPVGAVAGATCQPGTALVAMVRVLGFATPDLALADYRARLAAAGAHLRSGDCSTGLPGDAPWTPGDGQWGPGGVEPDRAGCFTDASGHATVIALCGNGASIEVVGAGTDIGALDGWTARFPAAAMNAGRVSTPTPPGICYGGWGA